MFSTCPVVNTAQPNPFLNRCCATSLFADFGAECARGSLWRSRCEELGAVVTWDSRNQGIHPGRWTVGTYRSPHFFQGKWPSKPPIFRGVAMDEPRDGWGAIKVYTLWKTKEANIFSEKNAQMPAKKEAGLSSNPFSFRGQKPVI